MGLFGISDIVGGFLNAGAAKSAAKAQYRGIEKQQELLKQLDPALLNELAVKADRARAFSRLALQKEIDPELAALRELGKEHLLQQSEIPIESQPSSILSRELFNEVKTENPQTTALREQLFKNAEEELKAGATLPPEFQAELMRAGINQGSQAGIQVSPSTTGGINARLLGAAGVQLKMARERQGAELGAAANSLQTSRYNILASVFPTLQQSESMKRQTALAEFMVANGALPESGLSGTQEVNAKIGNVTAQNNLLSQRAQVKANKIMAQAAATNQTISGFEDLAGGVATGGLSSFLPSSSGANFGIPGAGGASLNTGIYGSRSPQQQNNFNYLSSLYE